MNPIEISTSCPYCTKSLDLTEDLIGMNIPKPGDVSICIGCADILLFDESMQMRKPTEEEKKELDKNQAIQKIRVYVLELRLPKNN